MDENDDNVSEISDLSGLSEAGWRPVAGPISWVQRQMIIGSNPRDVLKGLLPEISIPDDTEDLMLWKLVVNILSEPAKRKKLPHINTIDNVVDLMRKCKKIMVLTGAGVSVSCGIPDFRSKDGIYARIAVDYPDLKEPQDMFDIHLFLKDPRPFFKFAKEIYPGQFHPSRCHRFIRKIEEQNKLLRNYTQNIDTLEQTAGIQNVIQCHGSFVTATCVTCKYKCNAEDIRADIMNQVIPRCPKCPADTEFPVMKPDIVFFGEGLSEEFHRQMEKDKDDCDLLIVIGSSLKVRPVALIPNSIPADCPQVLINREPLPHLNFDVELLGDCDVIVNELCHRLGDAWSDICGELPLDEVRKDALTTPKLTRSPVTAVEENSQQSTTNEFTQLTVRSNSTNSSLSDLQSDNCLSPADSDCRQRDSSECSSDSAIESGSGSGEEGEIEAHRRPRDNDVSLEEEDVNENHELETLREMWNSKRSSIASRLSGGSYLYQPPSRYVFKGAEVYSDDESSNSDSDSSSSDDDTDDESAPACRKINRTENQDTNNRSETIAGATDLDCRNSGKEIVASESRVNSTSVDEGVSC
ncbi:NAD-dependent protein deacetylase sirtuin-1-like [Tubulanus polymorphus]|uniref:NAD-dependent protein deacetylase sirtuin-1-like n=1 Tax=Tubulanus polymorphus TaxID=672921 RepID=UPI003DA45815